MARFPDGWVFIPRVSGPKVKDGKCYADVSVEERELVMCRHCRHWDVDWEIVGDKHFCPVMDHCTEPEFFCADGKRRDERGEAGERLEGAASASE